MFDDLRLNISHVLAGREHARSIKEMRSRLPGPCSLEAIEAALHGLAWLAVCISFSPSQRVCVNVPQAALYVLDADAGRVPRVIVDNARAPVITLGGNE
jgi:hypothetical protein